MFDENFYPTPKEVIDQMLGVFDVHGKTVLEPSSGKGDLVMGLKQAGANVIACELHDDLYKVSASKCKMIGRDFLKVSSEEISHIDAIFMNPPFIHADDHILHAYKSAPSGCHIVALCNNKTIKNPHTKTRKELQSIIERFGYYQQLGDVFSTAERKTYVEVAMIVLRKPKDESDEFEGFFLEEEEEAQENGIMSYNFIRDLVNRYVAAVKLFDEQLTTALRMNDLVGQFHSDEYSMIISSEEQPSTRESFKKDLQKSAWKYVFSKMNMDKYVTKSLKEDINKFVEKQTHVPFTMRNIYKMIEIIAGTHGSRMNKSALEVFDDLTKYTHENRFNVEGWKTNNAYLLNEKFIVPFMVESGRYWSNGMGSRSSNNFDYIEDLAKVLCHLTGKDYSNFMQLHYHLIYPIRIEHSGKTEGFPDNDNEYVEYGYKHREKELKRLGITYKKTECKPLFGKWSDWGFFQVKGFKKGTMHFKFKDEKVWALFNQKIAELKGYPLPEAMRARL